MRNCIGTFGQYGNDKFLNSIKKISQQLKRYFDDDDDDVANDVRVLFCRGNEI